MDQKHEVPAVSAAASFLAAAYTLLIYASESPGIDLRTMIQKGLQRLGPDHKYAAFTREQLREFVAKNYGEDVAAGVIDGKESARTVGLTPEQELAQLRQQLTNSQTENSRLRAEGAERELGHAPRTRPGVGDPTGQNPLQRALSEKGETASGVGDIVARGQAHDTVPSEAPKESPRDGNELAASIPGLPVPPRG